MTKLMIVLIAAAAMTASAATKSYRVNIPTPAWVGTTELSPGSYKVEVEGDKAVLRNGKTAVEIAVKVESGSYKHSHTAVAFAKEDSKQVLREIRVGGTTTTITLAPATRAAE
jgi:hypothetical protein